MYETGVTVIEIDRLLGSDEVAASKGAMCAGYALDKALHFGGGFEGGSSEMSLSHDEPSPSSSRWRLRTLILDTLFPHRAAAMK